MAAKKTTMQVVRVVKVPGKNTQTLGMKPPPRPPTGGGGSGGSGGGKSGGGRKR